MTTLIEQIKIDREIALKARLTDKYRRLTTLFGEASTVGKNANRETTDEEVIAVVKKFIKNIDECLTVEKEYLKVLAFNLEKEELTGYLPKQLTADQILEIVTALNMGGKTLGMKDIVPHFKQYYSGQYDGKVLSEVVKAFLAKD